MTAGRLPDQPKPSAPWDRTPLRGELFGIERLEEHARSLAAAQTVTSGRSRGRGLTDGFADNAAFLLLRIPMMPPGYSNAHPRIVLI